MDVLATTMAAAAEAGEVVEVIALPPLLLPPTSTRLGVAHQNMRPAIFLLELVCHAVAQSSRAPGMSKGCCALGLGGAILVRCETVHFDIA